jgi:hypothetical protein
VEDIVAEDQRHRFTGDEVTADDQRLGNAVGFWLDGVVDAHSPLVAVVEQIVEPGHVVRSGDEEEVGDPSFEQSRQRVVDHRLVVDGLQLLARYPGDRV